MQTHEFTSDQERSSAALLEDGTQFDLHTSNLLPLEQVQAMTAAAAAYDRMSQDTQPPYEGSIASQVPERLAQRITDDTALGSAPVVLGEFRIVARSDDPFRDIDIEEIFGRAA
jgi:hypothetical protein